MSRIPSCDRIGCDVASHDPIGNSGSKAYFIDINYATKQNVSYRNTLWTGEHLQLVAMHLNSREETELESHSHGDILLNVVQGYGLLLLGDQVDQMILKKSVSRHFSIIIPAGTYHKLINLSKVPLKFHLLYTSPHHPAGTIHATPNDAIKV